MLFNTNGRIFETSRISSGLVAFVLLFMLAVDGWHPRITDTGREVWNDATESSTLVLVCKLTSRLLMYIFSSTCTLACFGRPATGWLCSQLPIIIMHHDSNSTIVIVIVIVIVARSYFYYVLLLPAPTSF